MISNTSRAIPKSDVTNTLAIALTVGGRTLDTRNEVIKNTIIDIEDDAVIAGLAPHPAQPIHQKNHIHHQECHRHHKDR